MPAVTEHLGAGPLEAAEVLERGVPVGVVRAALDDGYPRGKRLRKSGGEEVLEPWCVTLRMVNVSNHKPPELEFRALRTRGDVRVLFHREEFDRLDKDRPHPNSDSHSR
jgi:hypothetical protein